MVSVEAVEEAVGGVVEVSAEVENGASLEEGRLRHAFVLVAERLFLTVADFLVFRQNALIADYP